MKYDSLFIKEFYQDMVKITKLHSDGNLVEVKHKMIYIIKAFSDLCYESFGTSLIEKYDYIFPITDYVSHIRNIFRSLDENSQNEIISSVDNIYYLFKSKVIPSKYMELGGINLKRSALTRDILYEYILDSNYDIPNLQIICKTVKGSFYKRPRVIVAKGLSYSKSANNEYGEIYFMYIHDNTFSDLTSLTVFTDREERHDALLFKRE